jgi:hypothetical protein
MDIGKAIAKGVQPGGEVGTGVERATKALAWMTRAFSILDRSQKDLKVAPELRVGDDSPFLVTYANLGQRTILKNLGKHLITVKGRGL